MSDEMQLIAMGCLALFELYAIRGHDFPVAAWVADLIARIAAALSAYFWRVSFNARILYEQVI